VEYKFRHVVSSCLSRGDADEVRTTHERLDELDDLSELMALLGERQNRIRQSSGPSVVTGLRLTPHGLAIA
jgi:hypothetical protein